MGSSGLDELNEVIDSLSPADRIARLAEIELTLRRLEAETALLVRAIERDGTDQADGLPSPTPPDRKPDRGRAATRSTMGP